MVIRMREKPFMVKVIRFDPARFRGDAPVKYLLPLFDEDQIGAYYSADPNQTFILRDDLHDVDLLCVRQGPISAGVGARALTGGDDRA